MTTIVRGGHVPVIFTYRRVTKRPEIKRSKSFIGWKRIVGTLVHRALEWVEDLAYEANDEVLDAGREESVHWALQVDDPWGPHENGQLVVTRVPENFRGGMNFEMIRIEEPQTEQEQDERARRPANFEQARSRMRDMIQREQQFVPPPPPQQPQPQRPEFEQRFVQPPQQVPQSPGFAPPAPGGDGNGRS